MSGFTTNRLEIVPMRFELYYRYNLVFVPVLNPLRKKDVKHFDNIDHNTNFEGNFLPGSPLYEIIKRLW